MPPVDRRNPIRVASSESTCNVLEFFREFPDDETCLQHIWRLNVEADLTVKPDIEERFWFNEWWEQTARNIARVLGEFAPKPDKLLQPLLPGA